MKPKKIGKYEVETVIGQGSFGKVYLGVHGNEKVALKCISKKTRSHQEIRNLKSETTLLTKIKHENIIMLKECLEIDNDLVVVMEYAGTDLSELLKHTHKLPEERIRLYARQILDAMLYLHQNRILHRDLKPQNILLQKDVIKICDFGFAKQMSASTNFLRSIKGTPLYIAPEILLSRPYTFKVDVWSFGVILYELATGCTPFYASTLQKLQPKILHEPVKFPSSMNYALRELIDGMLQKSEMKRFDWQQVKNHRFFSEYPSAPIPPLVVEEKEKQKEPEVKWDAEEECAYISNIESEFQQGKVDVKALRANEDFCLRITQFFGEACISREKVPADLLLKAIKLLTRLAKSKNEGSQGDKDIVKNKTVLTAVISLGLEQTNQQFLQAELELIAFLLKQNFDKIKIDTDHDGQITTLVARRLSKKEPGPSVIICLKLLGILTSQAMMTLSQSEEYFERVVEEKLLTHVGECYSYVPETHIVLECLAKFIHPKAQKFGSVSHKTRFIFRQLRQQVAHILFKQGFIREEPLLTRKWSSAGQLSLYCDILLECLQVSSDMRNQFIKFEYWSELLSNSKTKVYYLAFAYIISKYNNKELLSNELSNQIFQDSNQNELARVFLLYRAAQMLKAHPNLTKNKLQRIKCLFTALSQALSLNQETKQKHCFDLRGSLSQEGHYYDDILVDILAEVVKGNKSEEVIAKAKPLIDEILLLPLSQESLVEMLDIIRTHEIRLQAPQTKKLSDYLLESIKKEVFQDYMAANPKKCSRILQDLLRIFIESLNQDRQVISFADFAEKHQFIRLLFSEQLSGQEIMVVALRTVNKIAPRLRTMDVIAHSALSQVKKHYLSDKQDLKLEIIVFCSFLARISPELVRQLLDSGIVGLCSVALKEGSELIKEKTLHLIGNLAKHNKDPLDEFEKYAIVKEISTCLVTHKANPRILKNTIFAVGNISFYSPRFASDISPMIRYIGEGLTPEDEHLMCNTLCTISNLLRHGNGHIQGLIQSGTMGKVIELYGKANSADLVNFFNNVLKKAVSFSEFCSKYEKKMLKEILDSHISRGLARNDNQNTKRLRHLFSTN